MKFKRGLVVYLLILPLMLNALNYSISKNWLSSTKKQIHQDEYNPSLQSSNYKCENFSNSRYAKYPNSVNLLVSSNNDKNEKEVYSDNKKRLGETPDWTAEGDQSYAEFGTSVSSAGDVNGDGYSDVIIGAPWYDNGKTNEGRAFVYYGSASGLSATPDWTVKGDQDSAEFGYSVSTAGDVNGDGYSDVIIGAHWYDNEYYDEGCAFVYYGSSSGLSTVPNWTAEGNQSYAEFGYSVSTAGDVNGDGYSDVIIGAPWYTNTQSGEGLAVVYYGSDSGLSTVQNWRVEGDQEFAVLGWSVSSAGDVNGDGYSDVIIGAPWYDNGDYDEGRSFVYYGSSSGLSTTPAWTAEGNQANAEFGNSVSSAGDVNGDGYSDVIIGADCYDNHETNEGLVVVYYGSGSGLSTTSDWSAEGNQKNAEFGTSVSSAGDVNGDGYFDVIIGAPWYDNVKSDEGRTFVYYGNSSGLSDAPNWITEGNQGRAMFGTSISTAGDVNGDGYSDVIIGAPWYDNENYDEGRSFVYYGGSSGLVEDKYTDSHKEFYLSVKPSISNQAFRIRYCALENYFMSIGVPVCIKVYDKSGRLVKKIFEGKISTDSYETEWKGDDEQGRKVPGGVYFIYLKFGKIEEAKKAILLR